jgi:hypothetical protein
MNQSGEIKQFKLANGEEILCEVLQWEDADDIEILARKAMRLVMMENQEGVKYYAFRPWMVYQENNDDLIIINTTHIVGMGFPTRSLLIQYDEACADMDEMHTQREFEYDQKYGLSTEQRLNKDASGDKIDDYLQRMGLHDSASNNVINLFDKSKLH